MWPKKTKHLPSDPLQKNFATPGLRGGGGQNWDSNKIEMVANGKENYRTISEPGKGSATKKRCCSNLVRRNNSHLYVKWHL